MERGKIIVAGIGPGSEADMTQAVREALAEADVVVGYKYYFGFVRPFVKEGAECVDTGMRRERERAEAALERAEAGQVVCVVSSGDAGIYGMASLVWEVKRERHSPVEVIVLPGISAFQKAAALLGAPVGHDFCVLSLSDLLTPWEVIERRIRAAAEADFVTAVYNPRSEGRYWQLHRLREIFLEARDGATPVGYVKQAGRPGEEVTVTTLAAFDPEQVDMFTVVLIGNSESYTWEGKIITPRGYFTEREEGRKVGQEIMSQSFRRIMSELRYPVEDRARLWVLLHAIHTTADFTMEEVLSVEPGSVEKMYGALSGGKVRTIVTDVTMAASGIRKGALERLGIEVKCYLNDPRAVELAQKEGMTRAAAGFRIAVAEHPDALYVVGNAPTALMELCSLVRRGKAAPLGVVGAPVGFVHVRESKYMLQSFTGLPKVVVEGRKGGSNVAATIVNAILCYDDAARLLPGRDV